jgi:hypothetical protein
VIQTHALDEKETVAVAQGIGIGMTQAEVAREEGIPEKRVNRRWADLRHCARKHPVLVALAGLGIVAAIVASLPRVTGGPVAHDKQPSTSPQPSAPEMLVNAPEKAIAAEQQAEALRAQAAVFKKQKKWEDCLKAVSDAYKLSPDEPPSVDAELRQPCQEGYDRDYSSKIKH